MKETTLNYADDHLYKELAEFYTSPGFSVCGTHTRHVMQTYSKQYIEALNSNFSASFVL